MDCRAFLDRLIHSEAYKGQVVHVHRVEQRDPIYAETSSALSPACAAVLSNLGAERLYSHQGEAIDAIRHGRDVLIATGTASGKSLCYQLPLVEMLADDPQGRAMLLYPTKALAQDQFQALRRLVGEPLPGPPLTGEGAVGVYDGDTPPQMRRKLRDEGRIVLTNPDMVHAAMLPQHTRWAQFLQNLRYVVIDELHTYSGLFGSNAANLFRRLQRLCRHYGSDPRYIFCTATIGNATEVAEKLTGRTPLLIDRDGSPRGEKTYVFWNPPKTHTGRPYKTRRSANVEAHELMSELVQAGLPTITFSKAKATAELIYRYVFESLQKTAPHLALEVTPYRGGYLPEERRDIERRLFNGELMGVSSTRALELGIDIGGLDASVVVGYPGTLATFFQQSGRAGRRDRPSIAFLVAVDTSVNQYIMNHPEYIFGRPIERVVLEPDNAYVLAGQLRCAAFEQPIEESEVDFFGPHARTVLDVLVEQQKLNKVAGKWYHASDDIPHREHGLRWCDKFNVAIIDADSELVIGQLSKFDTQPIIHPDAIYMHQGETYLVLSLDLDRNQCRVKKVDADYYTQPTGGEDVHHVDHPLREKKLGTADAFFGEVSVYFTICEYEKIHFYSLERISLHQLDLPTYQLETMGFWITPPETLVRQMMAEGLSVHRGLMGIGYAIRMILPLFIQCETLDFSHSSCTAVNAPWHTMFVYERYPLGLGFTEKAYEILPDVILAVRDRIRSCDCKDGCPCCVGKPLRGYTTWNIELGEANIPSKKAALRLLDGIIGDEMNLRTRDSDSFGQDEAERRLVIERGIRRRLERLSDPQIFHPIDPRPAVGVPEPKEVTKDSDVARRAIKRMRLEKARAACEAAAGADLEHEITKPAPAPETRALRGLMRKPAPPPPTSAPEPAPQAPPEPPAIKLGDSIAARAKKLKRKSS